MTTHHHKHMEAHRELAQRRLHKTGGSGMAETKEYPESDTSFEERKLKGCREEGEHWMFEFDAFGLGVKKVDGVTPKAGDTVRLYGKGLGYPVRGVFLNGKKLSYQTEADIVAEHVAEGKRREDAAKAEFEKHREEMDASYAGLPAVFQRRLDKFRGNNPDFRWKYEPYEMFCCKQALVIAKSLEEPEEKTKSMTEPELCDFYGEIFNAFQKLPIEEQKKRVPGIQDGHSGNTFGCSLTLAFLYLARPEGVVQRYGALAPLVGSREYGCIAKDAPEEDDEEPPQKKK